VSLFLYTAKRLPSPCTWLSHAQSTMKSSDCLYVFGTSLHFLLVSAYLRISSFIFHSIATTWISIRNDSGCLHTHTRNVPLAKEHRGSPRFRRVPFITVPLSVTPEELQYSRLLRALRCCFPVTDKLSASSRRLFRGFLTFTFVAARSLLYTGFSRFVTYTAAA